MRSCLPRTGFTYPRVVQSRTLFHLNTQQADWEMKDLDMQALEKLKGWDLLWALSEQNATPVALSDLYRIGCDTSSRTRIKFGQFLHRELAIRLAQRAVELSRLPHGLSNKPSVKNVSGWYAEASCAIAASKRPVDDASEDEFTKLLKRILRDHTAVVRGLALGCIELKQEVGPERWMQLQADIDRVLTSFYTSRIGVRFLMEHHITSKQHVEGYSGILAKACRPDDIARNAAMDAMDLCYSFTGASPKVNVVCKNPHPMITYVPSHIHYMLTELLKNSVRAVVDTHKQTSQKLPEVTVVVAKGEEDITIRVSDEGGGIPRSQMTTMFCFLHTTAEHPETQSSERMFGNPGQMRATSQNTPVLAGWGVGLPLSRTYARYFGGDLDIKSMEGYGTDAYLHLNVLGDGCENLPKKVLDSPSMRDSSWRPWEANMYDPLRTHDAYTRRVY